MTVARKARDKTPKSEGPMTAFHGTDITSARNILQGEKLDVAKATAKKIDGPPGFFLATEVADAEFFALRRVPGGILEFILSPKAVEQLKSFGAVRRPIPPGKTARFIGDEFVIPTEAFECFNQLREAGEIVVKPH